MVSPENPENKRKKLCGQLKKAKLWITLKKQKIKKNLEKREERQKKKKHPAAAGDAKSNLTLFLSA